MAQRFVVTKGAVLILLAGCSALPAHAQCTPRAVVVGVSLYCYPQFALQHARDDAIAFSDWFSKNATCQSAAGSKPPVVNLLTDMQATNAQILGKLKTVLLSATGDDEIFIFISARGIKKPGYASGYILGYDGLPGKLHPSGITLEDLRDSIPAGPKRVFLFADISRELPNDIVPFLQRTMDQPPTRASLAAVLSAKPTQVSTEPQGYSQGLFTYSLMEQLKSIPGKITIADLYQQIRRNMLQASKSKQEPVNFGDGAATLELGKRTTGSTFRSLHLLLASLAPPPHGVFDQDAPSGDLQFKIAAQQSASDLEDEADRILLRYGEGNQFPDDPPSIRPGRDQFARAAALFEQALRTRPQLPVKALDDRTRESLRARMLFCQGRARLFEAQSQTGAYDGARRLLEEARAAGPLYPEPYNAIGISYLEQAQYGKAVDSFRKSIEVAPDWAYPRHNLALTYVEMGENAAAEAEYRAAIRRTPHHPYLYYNLGVLLQRTNRNPEAERTFRDAIASFEEQANGYRALAARLKAEDSGQKEASAEAALALEQAATDLRNEGEVYNALGALAQAAGKDGKARAGYEQALALNPHLDAARYNLGILALHRHRFTEAIQSFETVIQSNSSFPGAEEKLVCARKGNEYAAAHDRQTRRRLRQELKTCPVN
jgi:tetratricopeptide (TPR) repeat protein